MKLKDMVILGGFFLFISVLMFFFGLFLLEMSLVFYFDFLLLKFYGIDFSLSLMLDWVSLIYLSVILYISGSVYIFSQVYLEKEVSFHFMILLFLFVLSMVLLVVGGDLFLMFLGWDGLGVSSFLLVVFYQNYRSLNSGMITFISNRLGDVFMMMVVGLMMMLGGWNMMLLLDEKLLSLVLILFLLASTTKSAQFPFSAWLPAAMAAPTPVSALVHSSTLVTAGVFLLCRLSFWGYLKISIFLMSVSLITLFLSSIMACLEFDVKKVIALSTLSQLGLMMFIISLGFWTLGYFHMIMHAMFKSMLFLCGGSMIFYLNHIQDMRSYGVFMKSSFFIKVGFCVSLFSLCGMPFLSGFFSKDLIIEFFLMGKISFLIVVFFLFSMFLTLIYSFRLLSLCYGVVKMYPSVSGFSENLLMNFSIFFLVLWSIMGGSILQYCLFSVNEVVFLSIEKIMGLLVIIFGLFFYYLWLEVFGLIWGFVLVMFSDYFFLFSLSLNVNLKGFIFFDYLNKSDKIWNEILGPVGIVNSIWDNSSILYKFFEIVFLLIIFILFLMLFL